MKYSLFDDKYRTKQQPAVFVFPSNHKDCYQSKLDSTIETMLRFLLAALAYTTFLSGVLSFVVVDNPSSIGSDGTMKVRLSPNDLVDGLTKIPDPFLYPTVFAACFRIGAFIAVIGQPRLPKDDERSRLCPVGSKVIRLPEFGSRARVFYPITEKDAKTISTNSDSRSNGKYCTDGRATSDGMAGLVGFKQLGLSFLLAHLAEAPSGCYDMDDIPTAANGNISTLPFCQVGAPLLVYSHGYGGNMDMATYFLRAIAQRGIVVAALEHTDGTASSTVLSDGRRLDFDSSLCSLKEGLDKRARELEEAVLYIPSLLPGGSKSPVFLGGHSYGAPSVLLASQRQRSWDNGPQILGLILHDPALSMGRGFNLTPKIPTVSYVSDEYNRAGIACGDATYHVEGAFHGNFVDAPLWAPLWVMRTLSLVIPACGPADPEIVHAELAESARKFCFGLMRETDSAKEESGPIATTVAVGGYDLFERVA